MILRSIQRLLALVALALPCLPLAASAPPGPPLRPWGAYAFKSYGGDQGLTSLSVTVMAQDEAGFLWVGTEDGLFRYDGESFHRFDTQDGLPDVYIIALAPAPDGSLWVLTKTGLAHRQGGRFTVMPAASGLPKADDVVRLASSLACDAQCRLWITTRKGLYQGGPSGFWPAPGLPRQATLAVWINPSDGTVLASQADGAIYHLGAGSEWAAARLPAPHEKDLAFAMVQDTEGRTWVRGDSALVRFDADWKASVDFSARFPLKAVGLASLFADKVGRVWAPTQNGVACYRDGGSFMLDDSWGLPGSWAGTVLVDREGSLWVGSEGVHRILGRLHWTAATRRQGLPSDTLWSIARTKDGRIFAGTQGGLSVGSASGWKPVPEIGGQPVSAILADADGSLWVSANAPGSDRAGLYRLRGSGGEWVALPGAESADSIQSLSQAKDGTVWVASTAADVWRIPSGSPAQAVRIPGLRGRPGVTTILARKGAVFLASDQGLCIYDGTAWRILGAKEGLKSANIQALAMTEGGELWVSYADIHGLTILQKEGTLWAVRAHVTVPALIEDSIVSMAFDPSGALWLGTGRGVKRWDGQTCQRFGRGEGLPGEDADGNAIWVDPDGLWFGMSNGLARFDAREGIPTIAPPSAHLMRALDGGGHALSGDSDTVKIPYAYRTMDFDYAVPSYLNEGAVKLQVRLLGFENEWRDTKLREARYTALPPGEYRFEVRAALGAGVFGNPDSLAFRILAPWWRSWWFYGLCLILAVILVLASVRWRTAVLEKHNRDLEALIRARTLDLERANEQLQEASMLDALTGLRNRRYLGMNLPEEEGRVLRAFRTLQASGKQPSGEDLVFLLVDLDHFKAVNDTHGHAVGDTVLKLASEAIRAATRETDTVARWGGEEFLIIARRADRKTADVIARKVLDEVRHRTFPYGDGQELRLTCSVGYSAFPVLLDDPGAFGWEDAVELADQCLYAAKRSGRDAFVGVYLEEPGSGDHIKPRLLHELPELLQEGALTVRTSFPEGQPLDWKRGH